MVVQGRGRRTRAALAGLGLALGAASCGGNTVGAGVSSLPPPVVTPPPVLAVQRGQSSCYTAQYPAEDVPAVKGYRLLAGEQLPGGITPTVRSVRFEGAGASRLIEAEICFAADPSAAAGPFEAHLELGLYNADSEKLSMGDRFQPVRRLPVNQRIDVR